MSLDKTVIQAKRYGVFTCQQEQCLREAARFMVREDISALVVVDGAGFVSGIITRTDLLRALVTTEDWDDRPVLEFMNRNVVCVTPQTALSQVAELLVEKQIHRVVVVEDDGGRKRPVSVVSAADVVYHMCKSC